jgi:hypothetical protein
MAAPMPAFAPTESLLGVFVVVERPRDEVALEIEVSDTSQISYTAMDKGCEIILVGTFVNSVRLAAEVVPLENFPTEVAPWEDTIAAVGTAAPAAVRK